MTDFLYIAAGNWARQGSNFLSQILLARLLGRESFGELTYAFSIFFIAAGLANFGTHFFCWKRVAAEPDAGRARKALSEFRTKLALPVLLLLPANLLILLVPDARLRLLLHGFSLALVFNQVTFDWYFLSLDRPRQFFLLGLFTALIYLPGIALFVRGPESVFRAPVLLAVSCALPGLIMIALVDRKAAREALGAPWRAAGELVQMCSGSKPYALYDILQRTYGMHLFVVAGFFLEKRVLGQFRAAHLLYSISAVGMCLAWSYFNRVARDMKSQGETSLISQGVGLILLLAVPAAFVAQRIVPQLTLFIFGPDYAASAPAIRILCAGLALPVLGSFIREATVSTPYIKLTNQSYAVTIGVSSLLLVAYHPPVLPYLSFVLLAGETAGLAYLAWRLPLPIVPKNWPRIALALAGFFAVYEGAGLIPLASLARLSGTWVPVSQIAAGGLVYAAYLLCLVLAAGGLNSLGQAPSEAA